MRILTSDPPTKRWKREELVIIYPKKKDREFRFMERYKKAGGTIIGDAAGYWHNPKTRKIEVDDNYILQTEFKDTLDDSRGEELRDLLIKYNKRKVGENLLYAYTRPVSESTL